MSLFQLQRELERVRVTWKKETGRAQDQDATRKDNFIDGIVFGLKLAIDIVDKYRRKYPPKKGRPKGS